MDWRRRLENGIERNGPDDCHPWRRSKVGGGYGYISIDGKRKLVHRVVEEMVRGPLAPGEVVRHSCDFPPCCNEAHLRRGTQKQNVADCIARGRRVLNPLRGEESPQAKLTDEMATVMRVEMLLGATQMEVAEIHGVAKSLAHRVARGKCWGHLPIPERVPRHGPGLCGCGCGRRAPIAKMTNRRLGHVKGQPTRFLRGHSGRVMA